MKLVIEDIKPYLLFECVSGSRAYNLATENSDLDIKGVFYLPKEKYYSLNYVAQVSDEGNNIVYYELGRFVELLCASNPSIIELLNSPEQAILHKHPLMDQLRSEWFLSKVCVQTLVHYARGQIRKSQGLNKKILNPIEKEFKNILAFCSILESSKSIPLTEWLVQRGWSQQYIGLVKIPHARDVYAVYYNEHGDYQGVMKKENSTDVLLSSVPKSEKLQAYLTFNKDGYSAYCKSYSDYWQWVDERNEERYSQNIEHGRNYDSKNMMHTFRLLYMALGLSQTGNIKVFCENREELLAIKKGAYNYDELLKLSDSLIKRIDIALEHTSLPPEVDSKSAIDALVHMRSVLYT